MLENPFAETITAVIMSAAESIKTAEYDYIKGGLLHCGLCHTPKQTRINITGLELTVSCLCKCAEEARDRKEREFHEQQRKRYIDNLRINGIQDRKIRSMTFSADDGKRPILMDKARRYATAWDKVLDDNIGLLMWGNNGNGKTFASACIANDLIDRGIPVLFTSFVKLLNAVTGMYAEDRAAYINSLDMFKLLVIDDLGAERKTPYGLEWVTYVIDERYKQGLPTVITTNLTMEQMEKPDNIEYQRIFDRILAMCVPIHVSGDSRRKDEAEDKKRMAREMFG